jgi:hypothetical protein
MLEAWNNRKPRQRQSTIVFGGGCLFWLVIGSLYLLFWATVIIVGIELALVYVGAFIAFRPVVLLMSLAWWACEACWYRLFRLGLRRRHLI